MQSDRRRPNTDFFFFFFNVVRIFDQNVGGEAVEEEPGDVVCQRDVQIEQQNAAVVVQTVGGVRSVRPSGRVDERRSRVVGRAEQIRIQEPWIFFRRRVKIFEHNFAADDEQRRRYVPDGRGQIGGGSTGRAGSGDAATESQGYAGRLSPVSSVSFPVRLVRPQSLSPPGIGRPRCRHGRRSGRLPASGLFGGRPFGIPARLAGPELGQLPASFKRRIVRPTSDGQTDGRLCLSRSLLHRMSQCHGRRRFSGRRHLFVHLAHHYLKQLPGRMHPVRPHHPNDGRNEQQQQQLGRHELCPVVQFEYRLVDAFDDRDVDGPEPGFCGVSPVRLQLDRG